MNKPHEYKCNKGMKNGYELLRLMTHFDIRTLYVMNGEVFGHFELKYFDIINFPIIINFLLLNISKEFH